MYQLRNVINRRNVSAAAGDDFNPCNDFYCLVVKCHVLASATQYLEMHGVWDKPVHFLLQDDLWLQSDDKRRDVLQCISKEIVMIFVDITTHFDDEDQDETDENPDSLTVSSDKIQSYACERLSYDLEFSDSIREGDGLYILRCWCYLLLIFKANRRKNFAI